MLTDIEQVVLEVVNACSSQLAPERVADMRDLIAYGEPGVALENVCSELIETDARVSELVYQKIVGAGVAIGLPTCTWSDVLIAH